jgi:hypothetical protein
MDNASIAALVLSLVTFIFTFLNRIRKCKCGNLFEMERDVENGIVNQQPINEIIPPQNSLSLTRTLNNEQPKLQESNQNSKRHRSYSPTRNPPITVTHERKRSSSNSPKREHKRDLSDISASVSDTSNEQTRGKVTQFIIKR